MYINFSTFTCSSEVQVSKEFHFGFHTLHILARNLTLVLTYRITKLHTIALKSTENWPERVAKKSKPFDFISIDPLQKRKSGENFRSIPTSFKKEMVHSFLMVHSRSKLENIRNLQPLFTFACWKKLFTEWFFFQLSQGILLGKRNPFEVVK